MGAFFTTDLLDEAVWETVDLLATTFEFAIGLTCLVATLGAEVLTAGFAGAAAFFAVAGLAVTAFFAGGVCFAGAFLAGVAAAFWVFLIATFLLVAMGLAFFVN
jgi:hypothetical protein